MEWDPGGLFTIFVDFAEDGLEVFDGQGCGVDGGVEFFEEPVGELAGFGVLPGVGGLGPAFMEFAGEGGEAVGVMAGAHSGLGEWGGMGLGPAVGGLGSVRLA
jgi:hypothetical protein